VFLRVDECGGGDLGEAERLLYDGVCYVVLSE
jgi:hypothetical protein